MSDAKALQGDELARACIATMRKHDRVAQDLGIIAQVNRAGHSQASVTVSSRMVNGHGVCHGGYLFLLADSAFAYACNGYGNVTLAAAADISFVRPAKEGDTLVAEARERQRTRRTGIYDVEVYDQDRNLIALFRGKSVTLQDVIPV